VKLLKKFENLVKEINSLVSVGHISVDFILVQNFLDYVISNDQDFAIFPVEASFLVIDDEL